MRNSCKCVVWVLCIGIALNPFAVFACHGDGQSVNLLFPASPPPDGTIPVFPGAEGYGTETPAGRGGKIIAVTSLADSGPGSLRAAINDPSPRTIVFRVGGIIELETSLEIMSPFLTIAGQTAPGGGVLLKNAGITLMTHDVLIQHVRIRPGDQGTINPEHNDAISILGPRAGIDGGYNIVLDHISASWGEDETVSTWFGAHDITMSYSIISEGLNSPRHPKGGHSAGMLLGDGATNVSVHHNLFAHHNMRNPLIIGGGRHDIANNIIYNWGEVGNEIVDDADNIEVNIIGNTYFAGPSTRNLYEVLINVSGSSFTPKLFLYENYGPSRPDAGTSVWDILRYGYDEPGGLPESSKRDNPFDTPLRTIHTVPSMLDLVLGHAGATVPVRDAVDGRILTETQARTGSIISSPSDVGGYPTLANGTPPLDSDNDGMPDEWETTNGLNPLAASDANKDQNGDFYTNLENYLHSLLLEVQGSGNCTVPDTQPPATPSHLNVS